MRRLAALALPLALGIVACQTDATVSASPAGSPAPESVALPEGSRALAWGDGAYGVVLVHGAAYDAASWDPQARVLAENGMSVLAVDEASADSVASAIGYLQEMRSVERVAVLAASAGTAAALQVGRDTPDLVDQLIVLSGSGEVNALGDFPKLFAASSGEPAAAEAERMADEAPGDWNALYLAPGDAHAQAIFDSAGGDALLDAIVQRLEERR